MLTLIILLSITLLSILGILFYFTIYADFNKSKATPIPETKQKAYPIIYPSLVTSKGTSKSESRRRSEDTPTLNSSDDLATGMFLGSMLSDNSPSESHSHSSHDFSGGGGSFDGGGSSGSWDSGSSDSGSSFDSGSSSND